MRHGRSLIKLVRLQKKPLLYARQQFNILPLVIYRDYFRINEHDILLTTEQLTDWWNTDGLDPENNAFLKDAINQGVTPYPNCHIKPYTEIPFR